MNDLRTNKSTSTLVDLLPTNEEATAQPQKPVYPYHLLVEELHHKRQE